MLQVVAIKPCTVSHENVLTNRADIVDKVLSNISLIPMNILQGYEAEQYYHICMLDVSVTCTG